jgi:histidinol dehydrogenase
VAWSCEVPETTGREHIDVLVARDRTVLGFVRFAQAAALGRQSEEPIIGHFIRERSGDSHVA